MDVLAQDSTAGRPNTSTKMQNASMRIDDFAACLEHPAIKELTVEGTTGHLHAETSPGVGKAEYECGFKLFVQSFQVVRFQVDKCVGKAEFQYAEYRSVIRENCASSRVRMCDQLFTGKSHVWYSMTDTVLVKVRVAAPAISGKIQYLSLTFSAVNRSERWPAELQLIYLSSSAGYIQTPFLGESTPCSAMIKSCVTLTKPPDHVIFLTTIIWQNMYEQPITTFVGHCDSRQNVPTEIQKHRFSLSMFSDDFGKRPSREPHMSLFFESCFYICSHFRLSFSFHAANLKPHKVPGRDTWNCSVSVWPDLFHHFPCDTRSQCAEHEDEAYHCPYRSEKCGPDKIGFGGKCYTFNINTDGGISQPVAEKECQQNGTSLVSLETAKEVEASMDFFKHVTDGICIWIGMIRDARSRGKSRLNPMYRNTLRWESGVVVFFLIHHETLRSFMSQNCFVWESWSPRFSFISTSCENRVAGFLCELPSFSDHHRIRKPVTLPILINTTALNVSLEICSKQHLTHNLLACDLKSQCRELENTETWYRATCSMPHGPSQPYFYCDLSGQFVPYNLVCDFRKDCFDGRDEDFCRYPACKEYEMDCGLGQCVDVQRQCDGFSDCITDFDETLCFMPYTLGAVIPPAIINFDGPGGFSMVPLPENSTQCPETHFRCHNNGYCLPVYVRCNDMIDCPDHEDEADCQNYKTCPGFYRCRDSYKTICVHVNHLCDGLPQCPSHDDELVCDINCPESCACHGFVFFCNHTFSVSSFPQLRYLEASGSGVHVSDVAHNKLLIHLGLQACGLMKLTGVTLLNLQSVDLSWNHLHSINFSCFDGMPQLRILNLAGNPMSDSTFYAQNQYVLPSLVIFNISHSQVNSLNMTTLSAIMPKLQAVDLSWSDIKMLQEKGMFPHLHTFDLQGCPVNDFTPDFMKQMTKLMYVYADNFKLCCPVVLPDNFPGECSAPTDAISSCDGLLKSLVYRCALGVFAVLAVVGNFSGFVYRMYFLSKTIKTGFVIFVLHLCVSDFFMGVYLVFIGVADWIYTGIYIWNETAWKKSSSCHVAGFMSLLSSEVSAFLICLITLDRLLVLRFPFSHIRFRRRSASIVCAIMWTLGIIMAAVPLLPVTSHWEFYHQTGICIPLPVTRADFPGHIYSFSIMIICNLILFLTIGVGQCLIYWTVRSNAIANQLPKTKDTGTENAQSKEATIARRLLSVAVSDFLCWFPIGLCGVLAASGVIIPGEVNVGMAIFVLPLNSSLNPFLYTLNIIQEKRRRLQEVRFLKLLRAQQ